MHFLTCFNYLHFFLDFLLNLDVLSYSAITRAIFFLGRHWTNSTSIAKEIKNENKCPKKFMDKVLKAFKSNFTSSKQKFCKIVSLKKKLFKNSRKLDVN